MNEVKENPVYTVRGSNWEANVPVNVFNTQFSQQDQMTECATKAIEAFKGAANGIIIAMDGEQETPFVGPTVLVFPHNEKRNKPYICFTHVLFANGGFYADSVETQFVFQKERAAVMKKAKAEGTVMSLEDLDIQLENFDKFKKETEAKKRRKKK